MFDPDGPELDGLQTFPDEYVETSVVVLFPAARL